VTEVISALARRHREGALSGDVARRVANVISGALESGVYGRVELTRDVHRRAERFLLSLTDIPLRAADALHVALAASAHAASLASFDTRQRAAGRALGLAVYPG
jgi:predicted nucleic acid-binding protein